MLVVGQHFKPHRRWAVSTLIAALVALGWYRWEAAGAAELPGGDSLPGLVFGVGAAAIMVFEFLLWPRKKVRAWRIGSAQSWLRAHIWLGLLTVPLVILHSGLAAGGLLTVILWWLFGLVIASGIFGLAMQQFLPRAMLDRVPAETIYSQIDTVAEQYCAGADELVESICGPADSLTSGETSLRRKGSEQDYVIVGAMRKVGNVQGKSLEAVVLPVDAGHAQLLRKEFDEVIRPYLLKGRRSASRLQFERESRRLFGSLKGRMKPETHAILDALEALCQQRQQLDLQSRLHIWLHTWLCVHLPLSAALVLLLAFHVVAALRYQ